MKLIVLYVVVVGATPKLSLHVDPPALFGRRKGGASLTFTHPHQLSGGAGPSLLQVRPPFAGQPPMLTGTML
jgi:hypothetical protein